MAERELTIKVSAKDAGVEATMGRIRESIRRDAEQINRTRIEPGGAQGGFLKSLKTQLGEESGLGLGVKSLIGAGAVAGVSMATRALADASARAEELTTQFRQGKLAALDMADGLARSVPVLGSIWAAGRSIREIIFGEKAAIMEMNREAERVNATIDYQRKLWSDAREHARKAARERFDLLSPPSAAEARVRAIEDERDRAIAEIREQTRQKRQPDTAALAEANARVVELQQKLAEPGAGFGPGGEKPLRDELAEATAKQARIQARLDSIRKSELQTIADREKEDAATIAAIRRKAADDAEREQQMQSMRRAAAEGKARSESARALRMSLAENAAEELRLRGRQFDAETLMIRSKLADQREAIEEARKAGAHGVGFLEEALIARNQKAVAEAAAILAQQRVDAQRLQAEADAKASEQRRREDTTRQMAERIRQAMPAAGDVWSWLGFGGGKGGAADASRSPEWVYRPPPSVTSSLMSGYARSDQERITNMFKDVGPAAKETAGHTKDLLDVGRSLLRLFEAGGKPLFTP